jgi:hypothetical protein
VPNFAGSGPWGVLPDADATYKLEVETAVEARRLDHNDWTSAPEDPGSVRAVVFRTTKPPALAPRTIPARAIFPDGGPLSDLGTYLAASWPEDGAAAAYTGYDVVAEFNEGYVHRLYTSLGRGEAAESLHFRCADRNGRHVEFEPFAVQSVTVPANAGLLAEVLVVPQPPAVATGMDADAAAARDLWPAQFRPRTRYTLDVVPGPSQFDGLCLLGLTPREAVEDLKELYQDEDDPAHFPALARLQFVSSRYPTFADQMHAAVAQAVVRKFALGFDPVGWLAGARTASLDVKLSAYAAARSALAAAVAGLGQYPPDDVLKPAMVGKAGRTGLKELRKVAAGAWAKASAATADLFDAFVKKANRADLARDAHAPLPPNTEVSLFGDPSGVAAALLESPEPLDWRRVLVTAVPIAGGAAVPVTPVWNVDETRAVLIPTLRVNVAQRSLVFRFTGDIGAEAVAITRCGEPVLEQVQVRLDRPNTPTG